MTTILGRVTSAGYGYTVEHSIAYAYLPAEHAEPGTEVAVEIFGEWVEGQVATEPLWDAEGLRVRVSDIVSHVHRRDEGADRRGGANFQRQVPALTKLKLVVELELRGRGDIQLFRVEVPGPKVTKDIASDAKVRLSVPRADFNELPARARSGTGARRSSRASCGRPARPRSSA